MVGRQPRGPFGGGGRELAPYGGGLASLDISFSSQSWSCRPARSARRPSMPGRRLAREAQNARGACSRPTRRSPHSAASSRRASLRTGLWAAGVTSAAALALRLDPPARTRRWALRLRRRPGPRLTVAPGARTQPRRVDRVSCGTGCRASSRFTDVAAPAEPLAPRLAPSRAVRAAFAETEHRARSPSSGSVATLGSADGASPGSILTLRGVLNQGHGQPHWQPARGA
jgi:hypothetical protein